MTVQEKIQNKSEEYGQLAPVFLEGAKFALENQWINSEEDLPCNHKELIKTWGNLDYEKETVSVATLDSRGIVDSNYMIYYDDEWSWKYAFPKYWMPILKLPKEQKTKL